MRFLFVLLTTALLMPLSALAQDAEPPVLDIRPANEVVLDDFLWVNRVIVVFADTDRDPKFIEQMDLLADRPGDLLERDVVIITDTDPRSPSDIRKDLRPRGFVLLFIDKDGVIKLRKPTPWHVREIVRSIDKTELRQQELRQDR